MSRRNVATRSLLGPAAVLATAAVLACGGGGGGAPSGGLTATFTPDVSAPPAGGIGMRAGTLTGDLFEVKISVTGNVSDFYRGSFHVLYDPAVAEYASASDAASFLRDGGSAARFAYQTSAGDLAVTASRLPYPPAPSAAFSGPGGTPAAGTVTMQPGSVNGDTFEVRIAVTGVNDFFGAAFHVAYDPAVVEYVSADDAGSFLREGGASTSFLYGGAAGDLSVSATRLQDGGGTIRGVDVPGTRDLVVLTFRAKASATASPIAFGNPQEVRDSTQPPPGRSIAVSWEGGTMSATVPAGAQVTGTRDLVVLRFRARAATAGSAFSFGASRQVEGSQGGPIALAGWSGGTLTAR
jgi:hypothetical protein